MTAVRIVWVFAAALAAAGVRPAAAESAPAKPRPAVPAAPVKGLALHEWGVFSVFDDAGTAGAAMREEWKGLPEFVHGRLDGRTVPVERQPTSVRKPVIHLHGELGGQVMQLRVDLPGGRPLVWWPGHSNRHLEGTPDPQQTFLTWRFRIGDLDRTATAVSEEGIPAGHWMAKLRAVKAADLYCEDISERGGKRLGFAGRHYVKERFLYYDGVVPAPKGVRATVAADGSVGLTGAKDFDAADVLVIDRRGARLRLARFAEIKAGAAVARAELADADADAEAARLTRSLTAAGLNPDEAGSVTAIWKKDFFEAPGLTLVYRIPQSVYDRMLPLTVEPRPETIVRVGLVHHVVDGDPALSAKIAAIIKEFDAEDFDTREAATKQLAELGRAAVPHLIRLRAGKLSAEARSRISGVLDRYLVSENR